MTINYVGSNTEKEAKTVTIGDLNPGELFIYSDDHLKFKSVKMKTDEKRYFYLHNGLELHTGQSGLTKVIRVKMEAFNLMIA